MRFFVRYVIVVVASASCLFAQTAVPATPEAQSSLDAKVGTRSPEVRTGEAPTAHVVSRDAVVLRAMNYLYARGQDKAFFAQQGGDLVWCLYTVSQTSRDPELRERAAKMGRELAQRWRDENPHVPPDADADKIYDLAASAYAIDRFLGVNRKYRTEIRRAAAAFDAEDYMEFDPAIGPPPANDPRRFKMWENALVITFFGDAYGVRLGAHYKDVVKWLPAMHPYAIDDDDLEFDMFYGATHLVYTLNAYHQRSIAPGLLPQEIAFIKHKLADAMEEDNPEMVGESLDSLKALGQGNDPLVQQGTAYLLDHQEADGTWVEETDSSAYTAYHAAWTAIDGLRDYRYRGEVKKLPRLIH